MTKLSRELCVCLVAILIWGCASINNYQPEMEPRSFQEIKAELQKAIVQEIETKQHDKTSGQKLNVELMGVSCADVAKLIYGKILNIPFVVNADLYDDTKKIDIVIRQKVTNQQIKEITKRALNGAGIDVIEFEGCLYLSRSKDSTDSKSRINLDENKIISVHQLQYVKADQIIKRVQEVTKDYEEFKIYSDQGNDLLFYISTEKNNQIIKKIINSFDIPEKQIFLELLIFENQSESALNNGFTGIIGKVFDGVTYKFMPFAQGFSEISQFSIIDDPEIFNLIIGILQKENLIYKVANPQMVVKSGQVAALTIGDKIPVLGSTKVNDGVTSEDIVYQNTGINVKAKPDIVGNQIMIDLTIDISAGEINKLSRINSPSISSRSIQSNIICQNGQAVLIAGIYQAKSLVNNSGFPTDNKIIKNYLNNNNREKYNSELLFYIRPVIL